MKNALITGISGQDGYFLAKNLLKKNYKVFGLVRRNSTSNYRRINFLKDNYPKLIKNLRIIDGDLIDYASIQNALKVSKPDFVYNLAAQSEVGLSFIQPQYTFSVNYLGVLNFLEQIKINKVSCRFYQASTSEIFGNQILNKKGIKHINENTRFHPESPYANSKLASHYLISNYRKAYNLHAVSGILFNHESELRSPYFVTKKIISSLVKVKLGEIDKFHLGNIYAKRDWGYAEEYVHGMIKMLKYNNPTDFVLASGKSYSVKQFVNLSCEYLNLKTKWIGSGNDEKLINKNNNKIIIQIDKNLFRPNDVNFLRGSSRLANQKLNWKAEKDIDYLIKRMVDFEIKYPTFFN